MIDAGIVGLGWWGNRLVEAVQGRSDRIRFVHGVARDPAAKQEIARRHGLVLSPSLANLLGDPAVQAVVLATPHSLHRAEIEAAFRGGRDVVEGSRPPASRLPGPAELGCGDGVPVRGECFGQRAGVGAVVGGPPEAAVQEDHQRGRAARRLQTIFWPRGQPQVSHVVRILAIPNDQVRRPGGPAQNVSWFRIGLPFACRTAYGNEPFP